MSGKITKSPQIRFAGFTDVWEQRKLGDLGSVAMNKRIFKHETSEAGDVPFYKIGTFGGEPDAFISRELFEEYKVKYPYPEVGDILVSASGSIGKTVVYQGGDEYFQDSNIVWLKHDERLDKSFLKQFYSIVKWQGLEGSTIKRLYNKNVLDTDISVPAPDEQQKIGTFFGRLDNLISLHQRKLELLKDTKKSLLQKMFPKDGANVPEIRFAGFTNGWEQRKLSELLFPSDKRNKAGKYTQDDILAASLGTELVKKYIFFGLRSTEESVKNYRVVNSGDVIYTKSPIKGYPNGIIRTNKGLDGIVPSLYCVYHSTPSINSSIIQSYFEDKGRLDAYLNPLVNVGARNNVNITDSGFLEGTIYIPQDIDEQNKIVAFFNHLNDLITLHQGELNSLKNLKKLLLQQMFV